MSITENPQKQPSNDLIRINSEATPPSAIRGTSMQRRSRLGTNTKFTPAQGSTDTKKIRSDLVRRKRYQLQRTSQNVLAPEKHRITGCMCHPGKKGKNENGAGKMRDYVTLKKSEGKAYWSGVSVCGSVWVCPVCSTKIQRIRKNEVLAGMSKHRENGGRHLLVTYTFSHKRFDVLTESMQKFAKAQSRMKASRKYKNLKESISYAGSIRALETTYGDNGWHPHTHEIIFIDKTIDTNLVKKVEKDLRELWIKYAVAYGLGRPSLERGLKIDYRESDKNDTAVGSYVTKWADELTSGQSKAGRKGSLTPWQILDELQQEWTWQNSKLWKEYAKAMHGRSALFWSKGLKKSLGIDQQSDEEIAENDEAQVIDDELKVSRAEFYAVVRERKQAQVTEKMEISALEASSYIDYLVEEDRRKRIENKKAYSKLENKIRESTFEHLRELDLIN